ncbi:Peptidase family M50 [Planctomycetes bacterium CA13]|uniref:Peptidase family M50 n=1 Tax=Novipirellula herctigrandis TaxID=2527986 RepID=A0A5C5YNX2_9BACT|nr:Peptidase family M50 [Planctomycetes bacterium CA13]
MPSVLYDQPWGGNLSRTNTVDLTKTPVRLADDVRIWPVHERGERVYRFEIPELHRFFRVGYEEYLLVSLLDGKTTLPQACGLAAAQLGSRAPTTAQAQSIVRWLLQNELAVLCDEKHPVRQPSRNRSHGESPGFLRKLNPFWIKVPLSRSDRWIQPIGKVARGLFAPFAVVVGLVCILIGVLCILLNWSEFTQASAEVFLPSNWIWLLAMWAILKVVHEIAHAVAAYRQGAAVSEIGVVFILFAPLAYVDVTSCWRLNSRWSRIAVAAAGMYVELFIAAIAAVMWCITDSDMASFFLHRLVFAATVSTLLFNANPLMRFDGYFMLADLVDISNLYAESSTTVKRIVARAMFGDSPLANTLVGWRRAFLVIYGVLAMLWRMVICTSLLIAASNMFAGAGVLIAVFGIYGWFAVPIKQFASEAIELFQFDRAKFARGAVVGSVSIVLGGLLILWMPIPTLTRASAVVRYLPETVVRSRASGFVSTVRVEGGGWVSKGDVMMEITDPALQNRRRQLELELEQNAIRMRQAVDQKNESVKHVLSENRKAMQDRLSQVSEQCDGLKVIAERDGEVIGRGLEEKIGTYVREGDVLFWLVGDEDKEVIALVDQGDIEHARAVVGKQVTVHSKDGSRASGWFEDLQPRATDRLSIASLSATESGPLAVRTDNRDGETLRLVEPHFLARIRFQDTTDSSSTPAAGTRVEVALQTRTDSLAQRVNKMVRQLWYRANMVARTP